jgi:phosphoglycerate dehydrogenase-like enzyme
MATNVILLGRLAASAQDRLKAELGNGARIVAIPEAESAMNQLGEFDDADVIVGGPLNAELVERASRLKLFHVFRGGIDGLGVDLLPDRVHVCNTFHHEVGIAEFAVMAMLMLPRRVSLFDSRIRQGDWRGSVMWGEPPEQHTMVDKNVLIVGIGHIGQAIAARVKGFGTNVVGVTRHTARRIASTDRLVGFETWRDELPQADYVVASVRLTSETEGLFGADEFGMMKPSAIFINVARGTVAHERAMYEALKNNNIAGAAIDVWYNYPRQIDEVCHPSNEPFHELTNVLMSPNRSSWTQEMLAMRTRDVAENIRRLESGEELINRVR